MIDEKYTKFTFEKIDFWSELFSVKLSFQLLFNQLKFSHHNTEQVKLERTRREKTRKAKTREEKTKITKPRMAKIKEAKKEETRRETRKINSFWINCFLTRPTIEIRKLFHINKTSCILFSIIWDLIFCKAELKQYPWKDYEPQSVFNLASSNFNNDELKIPNPARRGQK
jgi:predicted membrane protein